MLFVSLPISSYKCFISFPFLKFPFLVLGIEPRASHMLGMCSTSDIKPQTFLFIYLVSKVLFVYWGRFSSSPDWPQIHYAVRNDLDYPPDPPAYIHQVLRLQTCHLYRHAKCPTFIMSWSSFFSPSFPFPFAPCLLPTFTALVNITGQDCHFRSEKEDYPNPKTVHGHIATRLIQTPNFVSCLQNENSSIS